jgi:hypothetical protein
MMKMKSVSRSRKASGKIFDLGPVSGSAMRLERRVNSLTPRGFRLGDAAGAPSKIFDPDRKPGQIKHL